MVVMKNGSNWTKKDKVHYSLEYSVFQLVGTAIPPKYSPRKKQKKPEKWQFEAAPCRFREK
jgi:hypothetical protein